MTSDQARHVRQAGHDDELRFAHLIGLVGVYKGDSKGKTDVIDRNGDAHSIKSGNLKWQIFLYRRSRIETDPDFRYMGIGEILINCIDAFPEIRDDYLGNKSFYKSHLQPHMRALRNKLADKGILSEFFDKAMFNAGEVEYLTVLQDDQFHVFYRQDVLRVLSTQISVENSKARNPKQTSDLKVLFKVGTTLGEIEMRTDSRTHFREVKFWLWKEKTLNLLIRHITPSEIWIPSQLSVYGKAIHRFAPNHRPN